MGNGGPSAESAAAEMVERCGAMSRAFPAVKGKAAACHAGLQSSAIICVGLLLAGPRPCVSVHWHRQQAPPSPHAAKEAEGTIHSY